MDNEKELMKDLSELLKQEGSYVKELTDIATKAAGFHASLESIKKGLESKGADYSSKQTADVVNKAEEKYSKELENNMKEDAKAKVDD